MRKALLLVALAAFASLAEAQVLTTEVWLGDLDLRDGRFAVSNLRNISNHPGYDNQPAFFADGASLLFATEAESVAETGLGVHAVRYWIESGRSEPLPKARGFSPTPASDSSITTLREGTVWLHEIDGTPVKVLLPHIRTAGYYARIDRNRWVLFMNEPERQIALWDERTFTLAKLVPNAVTAPYPVPGTYAVTFVTHDGETKTLRSVTLKNEITAASTPPPADPNERALAEAASVDRAITTIPFRTGGHHVWTARGTLLMASGNTIYEWHPDRPTEWKPVWKADDASLQGITRIALSPQNDRIALVSQPDDRTVLSEWRREINETFAASVAQHRGTSYERTPAELTITGDAATERGTWVRRWRSRGTPVELRGDYTVTYRRSIGGNGVPAWAMETETYRVAAPD